eukprot:Gb_27697 [translate_table: standard]
MNRNEDKRKSSGLQVSDVGFLFPKSERNGCREKYRSLLPRGCAFKSAVRNPWDGSACICPAHTTHNLGYWARNPETPLILGSTRIQEPKASGVSVVTAHFWQEMLYDPATITPGLRMSARQRWTPSQTQLKILERLYEQSNGPPSKQKIKELTIELSQHGLISETNVYNWFQNRKARAKRKQHVLPQKEEESEVDTDEESPKEKKPQAESDSNQGDLGPGQIDANAPSSEKKHCMVKACLGQSVANVQISEKKVGLVPVALCQAQVNSQSSERDCNGGQENQRTVGWQKSVIWDNASSSFFPNEAESGPRLLFYGTGNTVVTSAEQGFIQYQSDSKPNDPLNMVIDPEHGVNQDRKMTHTYNRNGCYGGMSPTPLCHQPPGGGGPLLSTLSLEGPALCSSRGSLDIELLPSSGLDSTRSHHRTGGGGSLVRCLLSGGEDHYTDIAPCIYLIDRSPIFSWRPPLPRPWMLGQMGLNHPLPLDL